MSEYAILFPGQGSQSKHMLESYQTNNLFSKCIDESSQILGYDIVETVQDESKLNDTLYTQPIMVATSIAIWNVWISQSSKMPVFAAGHSLGEYSALVANGTISLENCLKIVRERAKYMVDAMTDIDGGMAAVMSNNPELNLPNIVEKVCRELSSENKYIQPVNFNSKNQIVVAGHKTLIETCESGFKAHGAKRVVVLPVSVAAHSSFMKPCSDKLYKLLNNIEFSLENRLFPVLHNVDASIKDGKVDIIKSLCEQVCNPVLWEKTITKMFDENINNFLEIGPGKVLTRLNSTILAGKDLTSSKSIDKLDFISQVAEEYDD